MAKINIRRLFAITSLVLLFGTVFFCLTCKQAATLITEKRPSFSARRLAKLSRAARSVSRPAPYGGSFVIAIAATYAYRQFVRNLACSLWRAGRYELLLFALDSRMYNAWMPNNVRSVLMNATTAEPFRHFRPAAFNSLSRQKLAATRSVLRTGFHVLFPDADVIWCADAAAEMAVHSEHAHLVVQSAAVRSQAINTGVYFARATKETEQFLEMAQAFPHAADDQTAANKAWLR